MIAAENQRHFFIAVGLKMYFDHAQTLKWCREVTDLVAEHPAITSGNAELALLPSFPALANVSEIIQGTPIRVGAQDLFWEDRGPFTGEVGGDYLRQLGCSYVEIGHFERRRIFHEDDKMLRAKVTAALRNDLTPILCIGEDKPMPTKDATSLCIQQLQAMVKQIPNTDVPIRVIVAYEPEWAIGADEPAAVSHIQAVGFALKAWLKSQAVLAGSQLIYGGSAGPDLLTDLGDSVDGLFLGRSAHEPDALRSVLDEAFLLVSGGQLRTG